MTKERMQELQAKYAELFKFGTDYTCFLSYLKGMAENVPDVTYLIIYSSNALGYLDCLKSLGKISELESIHLRESLLDYQDDLMLEP